MKITFEEVTTVPAGVALKLSPKQVLARNHNLELFGDFPDVWVATAPMQFKTGETVEVVGDLPKGILPIYDRQQGLLTDEEINKFETDLDQHPKKAAHKKHQKHVEQEDENNG